MCAIWSAPKGIHYITRLSHIWDGAPWGRSLGLKSFFRLTVNFLEAVWPLIWGNRMTVTTFLGASLLKSLSILEEARSKLLHASCLKFCVKNESFLTKRCLATVTPFASLRTLKSGLVWLLSSRSDVRCSIGVESWVVCVPNELCLIVLSDNSTLQLSSLWFSFWLFYADVVT